MDAQKSLLFLAVLVWMLGVYVGRSDPYTGDDLLVAAVLIAIIAIVWMVGIKFQEKYRSGKFAFGSRFSLPDMSGLSFVKIAVAMIALVFLWMNVFETLPGGFLHRNRLTGKVCSVESLCWF